MAELSTIVLLSGGLDSAVLAADEAQRMRVHPVYVCVGLAWERAERRAIASLLAERPFRDHVEPLHELELPMRDIYPRQHWALQGRPPAYDTRDENVYLAGRNVALLTKVALLAASRSVSRVVIGTLAGNPFPDASREFFIAHALALSIGLAHPIEIAAPFIRLDKSAVIRRGQQLAVRFEHTLSCMDPADSASSLLHCGRCSKCRERQHAFAAAAVSDPTRYQEMERR